MRKQARILWKFQCKTGNFGFVIPDDRADWGGDFFVHSKNFAGAEDGQRVAAEILERDSGKKPEAKIVEVFNWAEKNVKKYDPLEQIEGIYSSGRGDFGFIDVPGREEGYFVYGLKKNGAQDGDRVRADVKMYNGKKEAIVTDILGNDNEVVTGKYTDNGTFWFVKVPGRKDDIFIAGGRKSDAQDGDTVEVEIIKTGGRRAEGKITKIL